MAEGLGAPRTEIETCANAAATKGALSAQIRLAALLGMGATPSFLIGGAGVFGYPARIFEAHHRLRSGLRSRHLLTGIVP